MVYKWSDKWFINGAGGKYYCLELLYFFLWRLYEMRQIKIVDSNEIRVNERKCLNVPKYNYKGAS